MKKLVKTLIAELSWHIECVIDGDAANPANFHPLIVAVMIMKWTERGSFKCDFSQSHSDADYINV